MAKRLSSIFSLSRGEKRDSSDSDIVPSPATPAPAVQYSYTVANFNPPGPHKLHKYHTSTSSIDLDHNSGSSRLTPPPLLSESGRPRPASCQRNDPDSRAGSPFGQTHSQDSLRSRPQTPNILIPVGSSDSPGRPTTPTSAKLRKGWLPGGGGENKQGDGQGIHKAWVAGLKEYVPYDLTPLLNGERVLELWHERGDTLVYLYPPSSGKGASFKIDSSGLSNSKGLLQFRQNSPTSPANTNAEISKLQARFPDFSLDSRSHQQPTDSRPLSSFRPPTNFSVPNTNLSSSQDKHLYLPIQYHGDLSAQYAQPQADDLELIVLYRNFFAFIMGGALVSTPRQTTLFAIFMGISTILNRFAFGNVDGSTFGEIPHNSFAKYCDELNLADVRVSREKTIEAIVLGESMRYWPLYNEGFAHAVGRWADIKSLNSSKFDKITPVTINRLERAQLDLEQRLLTVRTKLDDFDFPSMFAGIGKSQKSTEAKLVRFKAWRVNFLDFRRFTLSYYRRKYGSWPPKGSSKRNKSDETGLNRSLLREVYRDFTDLYDTLVDRTSLTTRTSDMAPMADDSETNALNETIQHALRRVESEFDRATPPVVPPIPFDSPLIPKLSHSFNRNHVVLTEKNATQPRKLRENEVNEVLLGSYNRESIPASPWIQDFFNYERILGRGNTMDDIVDARCGQWLFVYAVLQSLPMTVVDALDVKYTEGVEHFLCVPPRGGRPWMKEDASTSRTWYNVANGTGLVNLPADVIDHSVEGIYHRSHCWNQATKWIKQLPSGGLEKSQQVERDALHPPLPVGMDSPHMSPAHSPYMSPQLSPMLRPISPSGSVSRSHSRDGSAASIRLHKTNTPPERTSSRPTSMLNPNATFDAILGAQDDGKPKKKSIWGKEIT